MSLIQITYKQKTNEIKNKVRKQKIRKTFNELVKKLKVNLNEYHKSYMEKISKILPTRARLIYITYIYCINIYLYIYCIFICTVSDVNNSRMV